MDTNKIITCVAKKISNIYKLDEEKAIKLIMNSTFKKLLNDGDFEIIHYYTYRQWADEIYQEYLEDNK